MSTFNTDMTRRGALRGMAAAAATALEAPGTGSAAAAPQAAMPTLHVYDHYGWLRGFRVVPSWGARSVGHCLRKAAKSPEIPAVYGLRVSEPLPSVSVIMGRLLDWTTCGLAYLEETAAMPPTPRRGASTGREGRYDDCTDASTVLAGGRRTGRGGRRCGFGQTR